MKRLLLAAAATLVLGGLAACETATPYQAANPANAEAGGYRDTRLTADHWRVNFAGNSLTSRETVERYLLFRAAELTTGQGYDWFVTDDKHTDKRTTTWIDPYYNTGWGATYGYGWRPAWRFHRGGYGGFGYGGGWSYWGGGWGPGWGDPWGPTAVTEYNRFDVSAEIIMGRGPKPARGLDAREVLTNLGPAIQRPKA